MLKHLRERLVCQHNFVQNGVLRRYIQTIMSSHPKSSIEKHDRHFEFTSVVLYMAVTEKEGLVKDGGTSYAQGKWASFIAKVMRLVEAFSSPGFHLIRRGLSQRRRGSLCGRGRGGAGRAGGREANVSPRHLCPGTFVRNFLGLARYPGPGGRESRSPTDARARPRSWASSMWLLCNQPQRGDRPAQTMTVGQVIDDEAARGILVALMRELLAVARRGVGSAP